MHVFNLSKKKLVYLVTYAKASQRFLALLRLIRNIVKVHK